MRNTNKQGIVDREQTYRRVDGELVSASLVGQQVPAPPDWVHDWIGGSDRFQYASLAREIDHIFPGQMREVLAQYVMDWPENARLGNDLVISHTGSRMLGWAGRATINEIVMRYSMLMDITPAWISLAHYLPWLNDMRRNNFEVYSHSKNKLLEAKILLVDTISDATPEGMWFIKWLYGHRYEQRLPTITTIRGDVTQGAWEELERQIGSGLRERIEGNAYDYIATKYGPPNRD